MGEPRDVLRGEEIELECAACGDKNKVRYEVNHKWRCQKCNKKNQIILDEDFSQEEDKVSTSMCPKFRGAPAKSKLCMVLCCPCIVLYNICFCITDGS